MSGSVENLSCAGEQHKRRVVRVEGVCEEGPRPRGAEPGTLGGEGLTGAMSPLLGCCVKDEGVGKQALEWEGQT